MINFMQLLISVPQFKNMTAGNLLIFFTLFSLLPIGCSVQKINPPPSSHPSVVTSPSRPTIELPCQQLERGDDMIKKVEKFMLIFDATASMTKEYHGQAKFDFAKQLALCMNKTIPPIGLQAGLRTFGSPVYTTLLHDLTEYGVDDYDSAIRSILAPDGASPLAMAIDATNGDLQDISEPTAVIIISDAEEMDISPELSVEEIKNKLGETITFYTVLVGDDPAGKKVMEGIAKVGGGFSINADNLVAPGQMQAFVRKVFLTKAAPKKNIIILLPDRQGKVGKVEVTTSEGTQIIDKAGYSVGFNKAEDIRNEPTLVKEKTIQEVFGSALKAMPGEPRRFTLFFKNDSTELVKQSNSSLPAIIKFIKSVDKPYISIEGYADRVGSDDYNLRISHRRALYVRELLVTKGIDPSSVDLTFYGENHPLVDTDDGVSALQNRRVEIYIK